MLMHTYHIKRQGNQDNQQQRRGYRRSPGRPTDSWQQPATPTWTTIPPPSSPEIRYGAGYTPARAKGPTTSPPLKPKMASTDPELPKVAYRQSRVSREGQIEPQKLVPVENDESSLSDQLKCFAVEIEGSFKRMPRGPRLVSIAILICLFLALHILLQVLWQALASWINPIYLISGIIASAIVIYEFVKKNS